MAFHVPEKAPLIVPSWFSSISTGSTASFVLCPNLEELVNAANIKVEDADLKQVAKGAVRQQFAQYGMNNVPDDVVENYAEEQLKKRENIEGLVERAIDLKLMQALKQVVKLNTKKVTFEDFNKTIEA